MSLDAPMEREGKVDPQLAKATARSALTFAQGFDGRVIDCQGDSTTHIRNLSSALDHITQLAAMVLNLASRVSDTPVFDIEDAADDDDDEPAGGLPEPSGETMEQRAEVCAAWHALPDDVRKDQRLTRLYHALGGPRMEDPIEADYTAAEVMRRALSALELSVDNFPANVEHRRAIVLLRLALGMEGAQRTRSQRLTDAGYTRRKTGKTAGGLMPEDAADGVRVRQCDEGECRAAERDSVICSDGCDVAAGRRPAGVPGTFNDQRKEARDGSGN